MAWTGSTPFAGGLPPLRFPWTLGFVCEGTMWISACMQSRLERTGLTEAIRL